MIRCKDCQPGKGCFIPKEYYEYTISEYGRLPADNEEDLLQELYQRGPIACSMALTDEFKEYKSGVFVDKTGKMGNAHEVLLVGYGVENG